MAVYEINGAEYEIPDEVQGSQLEQTLTQLAAQSKPAASQAPQPASATDAAEPAGSGLMASAKRGIGLGLRSTAEGLAGLPLAVADLAAYPVNAASRAISGNDLIPSYQQTFSQGLTAAGLPVPETGAERVLDAATRGVASIPSGLGAGNILAQSPNAVRAGVGNLLLASPGAQAVAAGSAGASGQLAEEAGATPNQRMMAELAGGLVGGTAASMLSPRGPATLESTLPAGSRTAGPQSAAKGASDALSQEGRTQEYIKAVDTLRQAKIPLTKGQRSGTNWVKTTERTLSEVPFSGKPLQGVFENQQQAYQKRLLEMAGNVRGDKMVTRQTLENTAEDLSEAYAKALGNKSVSIADDDFLTQLGAIESKHSQFVDDPSKLKVKQIVNSFLDQASKEGTVTGEWYQAQRSLFAKRSQKTTDVADLYGDLKVLLDDAFKRSAGDVKGGLDSRYARFKQLQSIFERSGGPAASEGFVSPVAVAREAAGAPGGKEWQDFTRAAAAVLPDRLGNSGTAQRNFILGLAGGSIPAAMIEPTTAAFTLGSAGAGRGIASILSSQPSGLSGQASVLPALLGTAQQQAPNMLLRQQ